MTRCWLSETHLAINPQGKIGPCCRHSGKTTDIEIAGRSLDDAFNDTRMQQIRNDLISGNRVKGCNKCWFEEDNNVRSMREYNNENVDFESLNNLTPAEKIQSIEIAFSNHCNYKCRHCSSLSSSKWMKEDILLGRPVAEEMLLEPNIDDFNLEELVNLRHIKMLGGEPLINKNHDKFIKKLNAAGILKNVTLEYVTNGSTWPSDEIIELWKTVKKLDIIISLDDVEDQFDYFRTGGNFKTVKNHLDKFDVLAKNNENIKLSFHCVVNALNLKRVNYIVMYVIHHYPDWLLTFDKIIWPEYLKIEQWSKHDAEEQINLINKLYNKEFVKGTKKRNLYKLIKILQSCKNESTDLSCFFKTNDILDKSRNTNVFDFHPYMEKYRDTRY